MLHDATERMTDLEERLYEWRDTALGLSNSLVDRQRSPTYTSVFPIKDYTSSEGLFIYVSADSSPQLEREPERN